MIWKPNIDRCNECTMYRVTITIQNLLLRLFDSDFQYPFSRNGLKTVYLAVIYRLLIHYKQETSCFYLPQIR